MTKLRVLSLFAGIGGFDLGLERTGGFETVAFCEIEPFPQSILRKHWPEVLIYNDVRELTGRRLASDGVAVDVITGGFPCQDISVSGKRAGIEDGTRSGLWSEMVRLVREIRPSYVIVENVSNLLAGPSERPGGWFGRVLGDLAECGYDAEWENIPASALGASHRRERVWIVAYPNEINRVSGEWPRSLLFHRPEELPRQWDATTGDANENSVGEPWVIGGRPVAVLGRAPNGFSNGVDRIAALGNAVVPQIPELIGRAILASLEEQREAA